MRQGRSLVSGSSKGGGSLALKAAGSAGLVSGGAGLTFLVNGPWWMFMGCIGMGMVQVVALTIVSVVHAIAPQSSSDRRQVWDTVLNRWAFHRGCDLRGRRLEIHRDRHRDGGLAARDAPKASPRQHGLQAAGSHATRDRRLRCTTLALLSVQTTAPAMSEEATRSTRPPLLHSEGRVSGRTPRRRRATAQRDPDTSNTKAERRSSRKHSPTGETNASGSPGSRHVS